MGAIETVMLNLGCTQIGKHLGLPTHGYMVATESKCIDAQAGMESATSAALGALAGINMISGAGMLDSLACHSAEKLVLDAEAIASALRLLDGVALRTESLATAMFAAAGPNGEFLKLPATRQLFRLEQHFPSNVIRRGAEESGDAFDRARQRVAELRSAYRRPALDAAAETRMLAAVEPCARAAGLRSWPGLEIAAALHE